ncbi:anhydro-N-acetylmuramic acid kinase [Echinicola marina]|uniref:anhydro-N-acetylmuramic acid kinase n=1 Tax=Echinicola marina TaxID=2859768 RepID=UPI001CF695BE|nr:anhydro-N-acetylmuramic acid kinase [Echinicola marina]UCS94481.1 anhydro-N-acetylmuramic acid kinase [Echinicola marina]
MDTSNIYHIIGLMSGTSGDGLDMAHCRFVYEQKWSFSIIEATTVPFPENLGKKLNQAHQLSGEELCLLDREFGTWMGEKIKEFCKSYQLRPDAVASHGHTVFHQPQKRLTTQIGCGWSLMQTCGLPVINDFRTLDVLLGGQGAPLAPVGDHYLFEAYDFCLNLGGIANISMISKGQRKAFDTSPFNLLLNHFAAKKGLPYDDKGKLAKKGKVIPELLEQLNSLPYYENIGAKSLGRENIENSFLPLLENRNAEVEDTLATLVRHYAEQISKVVLEHSIKSPSKLLITGGGAYNHFFIEVLSEKLGDKAIAIVPDREIVDFKEALIFAFLGVLKLRKEANSLASVTGASRNSCGGTLYLPDLTA